MAAIRGIECRVYLNTGTYGTPVWAAWACVRSSTINLSYASVDATCRGSGGFRVSAPTLAELEVTGDAILDKDDATYVAMELASRNKTVIDVMALDGDKSLATTDGYRMAAQFSAFSQEQPLDDIVTVSWTLKPARSADHPAPTHVTGPIT